MRNVEGVRKITNRMEMVQNLRNKLVKARLSLIAVTGLLIVSGITNIALLNKLNNTKDVVAKQNIELNTTELELEVLSKEKATLEAEIDRLNSFDTLVNNVMDLEDMCLEMASNSEETIEGVVTFIKNNKTINTDLKYIDYIVSKDRGTKIRVVENNKEMFVVYVSDTNAATKLDESLSRQYYTGVENYTEAIRTVDNVLIVRHDYKF